MKKTSNVSVKRSYVATVSIAIAALAGLTSCATTDRSPTPEQVLASLKSSFNERGIAKLDRLEQTEIQRVCSESAASGQSLTEATRARLQKTIYDAIPYPKDGKYLGDWREGERIAQNGRGMQFSDAAGAANGANCYACHQISPTEISFGNQGPSLLKYGAIRGVKDPAAPESEGMLKYTYARIWNTHAFNACSNMPRFGDAGILTPTQISHVMALLLSPESPVNK